MSNQAEQDAAWLDKSISAYYHGEARDEARAIAARIREGYEQPDAECVAYTPTPVVMELGPETLAHFTKEVQTAWVAPGEVVERLLRELVLPELMQGFALVAAASDGEITYFERFGKYARSLADAMTPGEGESSPDTLEATRQLVLLEHQQRQSIQELEAERDEVQGTLEHAKAERTRHEQRLTAARKLLKRWGNEHKKQCSQELLADSDAWLKGQGEGATPQPGDYVLATKYDDGDPCDHFCVGHLREKKGDRFLVEQNPGELARANGFRRAERISTEEGRRLVEMFPDIGNVPGLSLWEHLTRIRSTSTPPLDAEKVATGCIREMCTRFNIESPRLVVYQTIIADEIRKEQGEGEPWDGSRVKADTELAAAREANRELNQRIAAARALLESRVDEIETRLAEIDEADLPGIMRRAAKARAKTQTQLENLSDNTAAQVNATAAELERLRGDRDGWAARSREQFDRIGKALDSVRQHRMTGEPARDDATEIEALVSELERLRESETELVGLLNQCADCGELPNGFRAEILATTNREAAEQGGAA